MVSKGLSVIEVLVVIAIIALLSISMMVYVIPTVNKSRDGRRKSDLHKIANALEEYSNDKGGYPETMTTCGTSATLSPYINKVPCEPNTKTPYTYVSSNCSGGFCRSFGLYTILANTHDPDIVKLGCNDANGCYSAGGKSYTYGVSARGIVEIN